MMGRSEQALRMGAQALLLKPDDSDALYLLGMLHFQRDEKEDSRKYLERFLLTDPELEVALEVRGVIQLLDGDVLPSVDPDDVN